jgi:hypothetical protein
MSLGKGKQRRGRQSGPALFEAEVDSSGKWSLKVLDGEELKRKVAAVSTPRNTHSRDVERPWRHPPRSTSASGTRSGSQTPTSQHRHTERMRKARDRRRKTKGRMMSSSAQQSPTATVRRTIASARRSHPKSQRPGPGGATGATGAQRRGRSRQSNNPHRKKGAGRKRVPIASSARGAPNSSNTSAEQLPRVIRSDSITSNGSDPATRDRASSFNSVTIPQQDSDTSDGDDGDLFDAGLMYGADQAEKEAELQGVPAHTLRKRLVVTERLLEEKTTAVAELQNQMELLEEKLDVAWSREVALQAEHRRALQASRADAVAASLMDNVNVSSSGGASTHVVRAKSSNSTSTNAELHRAMERNAILEEQLVNQERNNERRLQRLQKQLAKQERTHSLELQRLMLKHTSNNVDSNLDISGAIAGLQKK